MRKAFSLLELLLVVALAGAMAIFSFSIMDTKSLSKDVIKTQFQSHLMVISSAIFQCKELSDAMPIDANGSLASASVLNTLECNTSTPYLLDGANGSFIPPPLTGFTPYTATENGTDFYISTTTTLASTNDEVLQDLEAKYSLNQYELTHDATTAYLNFYLSR